MNIFFITLGSIAALILLLLIIALFTKKDHTLERQISINAAKDKVFYNIPTTF